MEKRPLLVIAAFFSIYVFWGSTYLFNKIAVQQLDPFMLASFRFICASILIMLIAKFSGASLRITKKQFVNTVLAGFLFLGYGNGVYVWALKYLDSGFASLEAALLPLVVLLMMKFFHGTKIKARSGIGVALGIFGMYLLVSQKELHLQEGSTLAMIMIFTCILGWAAGSLFVAKADLPSNFLVNTGYQMGTAGISLAIASMAFGEAWISPISWSLRTKGAMVFLILFGSIAAFTSFNYLLKVVSTEKVSTSAYVNPVVAVALGWYVLDEVVTGQTVVAAIILLTGVYFINSRKREMD